MSGSLSTSTGTIRSIHPRPSPPPSPPDSPALSASGSSVSSLPSVSSSFFFSSAAASPPHPTSHAHSIAGDELIIPSLTLPPPLPTPRHPRGGAAEGKQRERTAPTTRLLVLGPRDAAVSAILSATGRHGYEYDAGFWVEDDEDDGHVVLRIPSSRDKDLHVAEIELIVMRDDLQPDDIHSIERRILGPFRRLADVLMPPSLSGESDDDRDLIESLLASATTPLYTALVVVGSEAERSASILDSVRTLIPVVALPLPPPHDPAFETDTDTHDDAETDSDAAVDEADPDPPPTAPLRPRHANRDTTETGRINLTDEVPSSFLPESDAHDSPTLDLSTLRLRGARLFLRWWHAGARGAYSPDEFRSLPFFVSPPEKTPIPPHVYLASPPSHPLCAHANPYTYVHLSRDPLHLPSLLLLFRGVASATARQVQQARAWWGVGVGVSAFLVGVLVGVGFGVRVGRV